MNYSAVCIVSCMALLILVSGCTSQPATIPGAKVTTAIPATGGITPPSPQITDPSLTGTWYLKMMAEQNGTALVDTMSPQITAVFTNQSGIIGFAGCNNYHGKYTLTGQALSDGMGISIGPLATSMMYCANTTGTETAYLQILQAAAAYTVNVNQELTIMDNSGNTLVFQRMPYNPSFVPKGF